MNTTPYSHYLRKIRSRYYFRFPIPCHLQTQLGCKEFLKSLKTSNLADATRLALTVAHTFHELLKEDSVIFKGDVRQKLNDSFQFILNHELPGLIKNQPLNTPTDLTIDRAMVNDTVTLEKLMDWLEQQNIDYHTPRNDAQKPIVKKELDNLLAEFQNMVFTLCQETLTGIASQNSFKPIHSPTEPAKHYDDLFTIDLVRELVQRARFNHEDQQVLATEQETQAKQQKAEDEKAREGYGLAMRNSPPSSTTPPISQQRTPCEVAPNRHRITDLFKQYYDYATRINDWSTKYQGQIQRVGKRIEEIIGNIYISELTPEVATQYRHYVINYPVNREKLADLRDLTLQEIMESDMEYQKLNLDTAQTLVNRTRAFLDWCVETGYIATNPLAPIKITGANKKTGKKDEIDMRFPFTDDDLTLIFSQPFFTTPKRHHQYHYWLPLLGLYTGARMGELCQLLVSDVKEYEGLVCIDVTNSDNKTLKNDQSRRMLPIHQELVDLGFLDYVNHRKSQEEETLLDNIKPINGDYSKYQSKWFSGVMDKLGFPRDRTKVFHSFRHTLSYRLQREEVNDSITKATLGHKTGDLAFDRYSQRNKAEAIAKGLARISYKHVLSDVIRWEKPEQ